jgi:predicted enzyme related to lactoylglutathione lyase
MAKPKLALIPAAQGSKFYSVLPSSGVGDFNFTRSGSATRINSQGLIESVANGVSRLNYPMIDGVVKGCPHHILEPQRTNLFPYSEDFLSGWILENTTVVANSAVSPDGSLNADKIIATAINSSHSAFISLSSSISSGTSYCYSFFAKAEEYTKTAIRIGGGGYSAQPIAVINLLNGSVVSQQGFTSISVKNFSNGWYKINAVFTATSSVAPNIQPIADGFTTTSDNYTYNGDGTSGIYIWGAMFEQGSYATSYIPTNGGTVTRSAETANGSGDAATFNDSEGVLMAEVSKDKGTQYSLISLQKSSVSDTYAYIGYLNNNTTIRGQIKVGGTTVLNEEIEMSDTSIVAKILIKYKSGDYSMWVNGFEIGSNTNSTIFSDGDLNEIELGINNNNSFRFYGNTKQLQYFDTALTDSELETLTSWVSFQDMAEGQLYTIE